MPRPVLTLWAFTQTPRRGLPLPVTTPEMLPVFDFAVVPGWPAFRELTALAPGAAVRQIVAGPTVLTWPASTLPSPLKPGQATPSDDAAPPASASPGHELTRSE